VSPYFFHYNLFLNRFTSLLKKKENPNYDKDNSRRKNFYSWNNYGKKIGKFPIHTPELSIYQKVDTKRVEPSVGCI
jgi:hypothetical protein